MNVVSTRRRACRTRSLGLRVRPERSNDEGYELRYSVVVRSVRSYKLLTTTCSQQRTSGVLEIDLRAYMISQRYETSSI